LKWLVAIVAVAVLFSAAAMIALPRLVDVPRVQALVASNASQALGRPVRFSSLSLSLFPLPGVTLHDLEIAEDPAFGTAPFLTLERGRLQLRLRPLLAGRLEFAELALSKPVISVIRDRNGRLNIASLGVPAPSEPRTSPARPPRPGSGGTTTSAPLALPTAVKITDGIVTYTAQATGTPARYRIEGLALTVDATSPQMAFQGHARLMPGDVAIRVTDGILGASTAQALASAAVRANVTLDAGDIAPVVASASRSVMPVSGGLNGTLAVAGTVGAPTATGEIRLTRLAIARTNPKCSEPKRRTLEVPRITLAAGWRNGQLTGQPLQAEVARGTVTARLTADIAHGVRVHLDDLAVRGMALEPVLVDFLCQGYAVAGPLDLTGALAFTATRPLETLSGPGSFKIGSGKVVGRQALALIGDVVRVGGAVSSVLNADLPPSTFASPVDFDAITATYRVTDGVVNTRDLEYVSRAMKVAVAGDYTLVSGAMNLDVTVKHGRGEMRARVTGTAAAPTIRIVPASVLQNLDRERVESGLRELLKRFR
jgi:AsmA protein